MFGDYVKSVNQLNEYMSQFTERTESLDENVRDNYIALHRKKSASELPSSALSVIIAEEAINSAEHLKHADKNEIRKKVGVPVNDKPEEEITRSMTLL